jgi:selenide,water dikinase
MEPIKLTEYARGSGCGCKIDSVKLSEILAGCKSGMDMNLLLGNATSDDAAVYKINENTLLVSTTDFFTPIVDDAFLFGKIAATNALSDVYAMGANPIFALAILGFPVDKLPLELANAIMLGAKSVCDPIGISIAGGHSIDAAEPFFGLVVNGICTETNLKKNNTAQAGDYIYYTKKI